MRSSPLLILSLLTIATLAKRAEKQQNKEDKDRNEVEDEFREESDEAKPNGGGEQIDLSHGFGTDIDWVGWLDAISIAFDLNRPIFLLIHKTWCGACSALKKSFNTSNKRAELVELSKQFVMVNLEDDDEPEEEIYAPDGRYIPRLFILDKKGEPLAVDNAKNYPNNRQYFPQVLDVIKAMKKGLDIFEGGERKKEENSPKGPKELKKVAKKKKEEEDSPKEPKKVAKKEREEEEMKNKDDLKAGDCPHVAGKATKKAVEAAKKEEEKKQTKEKGKKKIKENKNEKKNGKGEGEGEEKMNNKKKEGEKEQKNGKKKEEKIKEEL